MIYTIEATGQEGAFAYRYQYEIGSNNYFGYAGSESEALRSIEFEKERKNYQEAKAKGEEVWNTWSYICALCDSAIEITSNREPIHKPTCICSDNRKEIVLISEGKAGK